MAKWRAIERDISTSGKVNRLDEFGQLLWDRMILWSDDWGIITGEAFELKLKTIPASKREEQEFEDRVNQMEQLGLIRRYEPDGHGPLIWLIDFDDHQPAAVIGKRTEPKDPLHPDDIRFHDNPGNSTKSDEKGSQTRQDKNRQDKNRIDQTTTDKSENAAVDVILQSIKNRKQGLLEEIGVKGKMLRKLVADDQITPEQILSCYEDACKSPTVRDPVAVTISNLKELTNE